MRLKDRVAIVTGGAQGIGRAYVQRFAAEGAKVVIADILDEVAKATAEEARACGGDVVAITTDVSEESGANAMARQTIELHGRIDVLVNNAAVVNFSARRPFWEIGVEEWDRVMAVNVKGIFLCCKAVFPYMRAQGKGKIINISSSTFWEGTGGIAHYVSSKAAIVGLTRAFARDLGDCGINVNAITPGMTATETILRNRGGVALDAYAKTRCIKRREVPEDLVGTVVFLASDDSDFITGQTINVDGGETFH